MSQEEWMDMHDAKRLGGDRYVSNEIEGRPVMLQIMPAPGWSAQFEFETKPLVAWALFRIKSETKIVGMIEYRKQVVPAERIEDFKGYLETPSPQKEMRPRQKPQPQEGKG